MEVLSRIERTAAPQRETHVLMKTKESNRRDKQHLLGQLWRSLKEEIPEQVRFIRKHLVWYRSPIAVREHLLADLYCPEARLVVLLGHAPVLSLNEEIREARLREAGYRVLRLNIKEGDTERWTDRIKGILLQAGMKNSAQQLSLDF
jgi:very-short-patch-repair endonuclease